MRMSLPQHVSIAGERHLPDRPFVGQELGTDVLAAENEFSHGDSREEVRDGLANQATRAVTEKILDLVAETRNDFRAGEAGFLAQFPDGCLEVVFTFFDMPFWKAPMPAVIEQEIMNEGGFGSVGRSGKGQFVKCNETCRALVTGHC
jgi:hypothetical protein